MPTTKEKPPTPTLRDRARRAVERLIAPRAPVTDGRAVGGPRSERGSYPSVGGGSFSGRSGGNVVDRLRHGPPASPAGIDAHLDEYTLGVVRADSRELLRNNSPARGALKRLVDSVGSLTLSADTADERWNTAVQNWWEVASGELDARGFRGWNELLATWVFQPACDGDGLLLFLDSGTVQYVEGERIVTPTRLRSDTKIRAGVEFAGAGASGRPVAYHVANYDAFGRVKPAEAVRVPAENCVFLTAAFTPWANNTRGEPLFAATVPLFEALVRYLVGEITKAELAAYLSLVITSGNPGELADMLAEAAQNEIAAEGGDSGDSEEGGGQPHQVWKPGAVLNLGMGEDAKIPSADVPNQAADPFTRMILRLIGADIGMPLSLWLLDASEENFHGFKSSQANFARGIVRPTVALMRAASRVYRWRLARAIAAGELPVPPAGIEDPGRHSWTPEPMPSPDEKGELEALAFGFEKRIYPLEYAHQRTGFRKADVFTKIAAEMEEMERLGITPVPSQGAAAAPAPEKNKQNAEDAEPGNDAENAESPEKNGEAGTPPGGQPGNIKPGGTNPGGAKPGGAGPYLVGDKTLAADMVESVVKREMPPESAKAILSHLVGLGDAQVSAIIDPTAGFEGPEPEPATADEASGSDGDGRA